MGHTIYINCLNQCPLSIMCWMNTIIVYATVVIYCGKWCGVTLSCCTDINICTNVYILNELSTITVL